ncbi:MAG: AAA family ATPase [Chloroflexota bacterium]
MIITIPDPALVLLIGPAGAGKSTFAAAHFQPVEIVSSDHLRGLLSNDPADQSASAEAFRILVLMVSGRLKRRLTTVIDATSLLAANRSRYRAIAARHGVPVIAVAFDLPVATFFARNRERSGRVVSEEVVERQVDQMVRALTSLPAEHYAALFVLKAPETAGIVIDRVVSERRWDPRDSSEIGHSALVVKGPGGIGLNSLLGSDEGTHDGPERGQCCN